LDFRVGEKRVKIDIAAGTDAAWDVKSRISHRQRQDLSAGPDDSNSGLLKSAKPKNGFGDGQESEALEQQPQNAASDPMGRDDNNSRSFQCRNQYRSNRDRDHAEGETSPPLAPNSVSLLQSRLNKSCYDEIPGAYRGNQAARNQQQKIGASHVGEARPEQAEREDLVKDNVGSQ
jgi:hypothetical protein